MPVTETAQMHWDEPLVTHDQMQQFYPHLEKMLEDIEFLDPNNPRLLPLRLRRLFGRIQLDKMEYHLLRGIFSRVQALNKGTWKPSTPKTQDKEDPSDA
jgi:tRNA (cytidine32/uridine32-2'-O)-methyltransferase